MGEKNRARAIFTLDELAQTIDQRAGANAETSYTRSLLDKGAAHCARKFGEEAIDSRSPPRRWMRPPFAPRRLMFFIICLSCFGCGSGVVVGDGRIGQTIETNRPPGKGVAKEVKAPSI